MTRFSRALDLLVVACGVFAMFLVGSFAFECTKSQNTVVATGIADVIETACAAEGASLSQCLAKFCSIEGLSFEQCQTISETVTTLCVLDGNPFDPVCVVDTLGFDHRTIGRLRAHEAARLDAGAQ